ncbi:MAG: hypothetical protein LUD27_04970 [Clostridia bacterium]|nr:hypothetical protein [Clostridia bacterium]
MDNLTEEMREADLADAEKPAKEDLGKFKDVQALLNAYNNLEAEFTRRSQRLKELELQNNPQTPAKAANGTADSAKTADAELYGAAASNAAVKDRIIGDYLKTVMQNKGAPFVTGGVPVSTPPNKPASIKEAGRLAAEFLRKNN